MSPPTKWSKPTVAPSGSPKSTKPYTVVVDSVLSKTWLCDELGFAITSVTRESWAASNPKPVGDNGGMGELGWGEFGGDAQSLSCPSSSGCIKNPNPNTVEFIEVILEPRLLEERRRGGEEDADGGGGTEDTDTVDALLRVGIEGESSASSFTSAFVLLLL